MLQRAVSALKDAKQRAKLLSLLLLWRKGRSGTNIFRALLLSGLFFAPRGAWEFASRTSGLGETALHALAVLALQCCETVIPEFTTCFGLSGSLISAACAAGVPPLVLQCSISILLFQLFCESTSCLPPSYARFVASMAGPPWPMYTPDSPFRTKERVHGSLAEALDPAAVFSHARAAFPRVFRVFLILNFVVKPIIARLRPKPTSAAAAAPSASATNGTHESAASAASSAAASASMPAGSVGVVEGKDSPAPAPAPGAAVSSRSDRLRALASWISKALANSVYSATYITGTGIVGFICNRWHISDSPLVTTVVRAPFSILATLLAQGDEWESSLRPLFIYLFANALFACFNVVGGRLGVAAESRWHPLAVLNLVHPVLSALGVVAPSLGSGIVLRAFS